MRLFLAIEVPDIVKSQIASFIQKIQRNFPDLDAKWVVPQNLHVTLAFLGETREDCLPSVKNAAAQAANKRQTLSLELEGLGVFPNPSFIRIVWIGMRRGGDEVKTLCRDLRQNLLTAHINFDQEQDFHPHLTLARVQRPPRRREEFQKFLQTENPNFGSWKSKELSLVKSRLAKPYPIYTTLLKFPFVSDENTS